MIKAFALQPVVIEEDVLARLTESMREMDSAERDDTKAIGRWGEGSQARLFARVHLILTSCVVLLICSLRDADAGGAAA